MNGIVPEPAPPPGRDDLARVQVKRQSETVRCEWIGIVARRHREIHEAMKLVVRERRSAPDAVQKALDAPVVLVGFADRVERHDIDHPFFAARAFVLGELVEGGGPVAAVDEIEVRVARVAGDRAPKARVLYARGHY